MILILLGFILCIHAGEHYEVIKKRPHSLLSLPSVNPGNAISSTSSNSNNNNSRSAKRLKHSQIINSNINPSLHHFINIFSYVDSNNIHALETLELEKKIALKFGNINGTKTLVSLESIPTASLTETIEIRKKNSKYSIYYDSTNFHRSTLQIGLNANGDLSKVDAIIAGRIKVTCVSDFYNCLYEREMPPIPLPSTQSQHLDKTSLVSWFIQNCQLAYQVVQLNGMSKPSVMQSLRQRETGYKSTRVVAPEHSWLTIVKILITHGFERTPSLLKDFNIRIDQVSREIILLNDEHYETKFQYFSPRHIMLKLHEMKLMMTFGESQERQLKYIQLEYGTHSIYMKRTSSQSFLIKGVSIDPSLIEYLNRNRIHTTQENVLQDVDTDVLLKILFKWMRMEGFPGSFRKN